MTTSTNFSVRLKLTPAHKSQTFPADVIYSQPLDITWPYHVTGSALSVVGPSLLPVRQSGIHYRTVSVTRRSAATASDNRWKWIYFVTITHSAHTVQWRCLMTLRYINLLYTLTWTFCRHVKVTFLHNTTLTRWIINDILTWRCVLPTCSSSRPETCKSSPQLQPFSTHEFLLTVPRHNLALGSRAFRISAPTSGTRSHKWMFIVC